MKLAEVGVTRCEINNAQGYNGAVKVFMRSSTIMALLMCAVLSSGCASIVSRTQWPVWINSAPSGALVHVINKEGTEVACVTTPSKVKLRSGAGYFSPAKYTFQFEKDGYAARQVDRSAGLNPWYFGNILLGGFPGMVIVDPLTGAMWHLDDHVMVRLLPLVEVVAPVSVVTKDAIYLKDGSIIKGQLLEIRPGKQYRLRRSDGTEQVFQADLVERIERKGT